MDLQAFRAWTQALQASLVQNEQVLAFIALGSMAEVGRLPDAWSDHDFFVITPSGAQEKFRQDLNWLPEPERIVMRIRETAHGLKVLYDDGHLLEFAIFDEQELRQAKINDYRVLFSRLPLDAILQQIHQAPPTPEAISAYDGERDLLMVLGLCFVGMGRYARGERLSAHIFIKGHVLHHLLPLVVNWTIKNPEKRQVLDSLDPFRRLEQASPDAANLIQRALLLPVPDCALIWLDWVEGLAPLHLKPEQVPTAAFATVRPIVERLAEAD